MHRISLATATVLLAAFGALSAHAGAIEICTEDAETAASNAAIAAVKAHPWKEPQPHNHGPSFAAAYDELIEAGFEEVEINHTIDQAWDGITKQDNEKLKDFMLKNIRAIRGALQGKIVASYCTNDPTDCYGVLDIDVNTNIVYNETTGRMVDLSVCRSKGLAGSSLNNRDLSGANLSGANLRGADFSNSNLTEANLQGADLQGSTFTQAILDKAKLTAANLRGALLEKVSLVGAKLSGADLTDALLQKANLVGADLRGAVLDGADLRDTAFTNAILAGASLKGARLNGGKFIGAGLTLSQLSVANWAGAILEARLTQGLKDLHEKFDELIED